MKKSITILKGKIENLTGVRTSTANSMVTFKIGKTPCKAFGKGAETVSQWIQVDPNSSAEFEGYFDRHSAKFGTEFVAVHGRAIESDRITNVVSPEMAVSGTAAPGATLASSPSALFEPIPAKEPVGNKTNVADKNLTTTPSHPHAARSPQPAIGAFREERVTFEDLENQYKASKAAREMENRDHQIPVSDNRCNA